MRRVSRRLRSWSRRLRSRRRRGRRRRGRRIRGRRLSMLMIWSEGGFVRLGIG